MASPAQSTLERRLGPLDGAAIIVSNVIGGTILFAPPFMAGLVPNPWLYLGLWVAGGALAFAGAMAYAELAALRPKAGGEYVYLDAAYGRVAAFLTGWTSFVAGFAGAIAANAFFIPIYLARFIPGVDNQTPIFTIPLPYVPLTFSVHTIVALASVWLLAAIHIRGVGPGRVTMNILAALKVTAFLLFVLAGFAFGTGAFSNVTTAGGSVSAGNWLFAFIPVMLAYSGWNASAYVAEEIRDPGRNLPRSLAIDDAVGGEVGVELGGRGGGGGRLGPVVELCEQRLGFCDDPDDAGGGDIKQCGDVLGGCRGGSIRGRATERGRPRGAAMTNDNDALPQPLNDGSQPIAEHRLFSHISMNWRGKPLTSHEVIVNTIAATTTDSGLRSWRRAYVSMHGWSGIPHHPAVDALARARLAVDADRHHPAAGCPEVRRCALHGGWAADLL